MNKLAERLTELRTQSGLSQREFSKRVSIAQPTVANWEVGRREPSIDTLIKIAQFFDVSLDYLVGREGYDI